jgi:hypothetical protein
MEVEAPFLSTTAGESAFFRALCDARPVGVHREFHMMAVAAHIQSATGNAVSVDELWGKFKSCYDQKILEGYVSFSVLDLLSSTDDCLDFFVV